MKDGLGLVEDEAVWHAIAAEYEIHLSAMTQTIDGPGRVLVTALALIGDIEIVVGGEVQIVEALEASVAAAIGARGSGRLLRIEGKDAVAMVGDEDAAVAGGA